MFKSQLSCIGWKDHGENALDNEQWTQLRSEINIANILHCIDSFEGKFQVSMDVVVVGPLAPTPEAA